MENETSPWVPQPDGTYLPSSDLMKAIRENPDQFPNAADDLTVLSGKTREEVDAILASNQNPSGALGRGLSRGFGQAVGWAGAKLFGTDQDAVANTFEINPSFDTEKGVVEKVGEVAGQIAPAVAGGLAGGIGIGGAIAGSGIAALTFSDEDNIANLANDYIDGLIPDFLVTKEDDSPEMASARFFASDLITGLMTGGLLHGVAKVYKAFKEVPSGLAQLPEEASRGTAGLAEELQRIADEYGVTPTPSEGSTAAATKAVEDVARQAADEVPTVLDDQVVLKGSARDKLAEDITARQLYHSTEGVPAPHPIPQDVAQTWRKDVMAPVQRLLNRSRETNSGLRQSLNAVEEGPVYKQMQELTEAALRAAYHSNEAELIRVVKEADNIKHDAAVVLKNSILQKSLETIDTRFDEIVNLLREKPDMKTRAALKEVAGAYDKTRATLWELRRQAGSAPSYAMLVRKGVKFDDVIKEFDEADEAVEAMMKERGWGLKATKAEFKSTRLLTYEEMGYDTLEILEYLDNQFKEFELSRAGAIDNARLNALSKMSKEQRALAEASFLRWLNDMHSSALLGQVSTAALEGMSNTINIAVLPLVQHVFGSARPGRALREYAGYMASMGLARKSGWQALKKGRSVTDNFDVLDAQHSSMKDAKGPRSLMNRDYEDLAAKGKHFQALMYRLWDFAAGLAISASEAAKALRYGGLAYADGFDMAIKSGATRPQAKKMAKDYVAAQFNPDGSFKNTALKLQVQQDSWQAVFDTRYGAGNLAQRIDNLRNSSNPLVNIPARATIPFWRTLINIGSNSMQTVQPIPASILKPILKTKWGSKFGKTFKFLDDFTGANGIAAKQKAIGRQRLGYTMFGAAYALAEGGFIDITGPSALNKRWDAKMAEGREYPGSSIIIGGKSFDLTRLLPYSAPLLLVGLMRDAQRENMLQMKDGNYVAHDDSAWAFIPTLGTSLGMLSLHLMSDSAGLRGISDLLGSVSDAIKEGDITPIAKMAEDYGKQFMPGAPRMIGKNRGAFAVVGLSDGDWTQYEAEGFINEVLASSGFPVGWKRLDFFGHPVDDDWLRGVDPLNAKPVRTDDPARAEYVLLNKTGELGLQLDKPVGVFDKAYWKGLGVQYGFLERLFGDEAPSLNEMKTQDGSNAWARYRDYVYKGVASKDLEVQTGSSGDRINIGPVTILKGENFEAAMRRIIASQGYSGLDPSARVKVWRAVFGKFKKDAKEHLKENLMVDPSIFKKSRNGSPISEPTTLAVTEAAAKERAVQVQRTRGIPLDDIFAIR